MISQATSHYRSLGKLGEGGMVVVYKSEDTRLGRFAALKFFPSHLYASEQEKVRLTQEPRAAAALNHPNVCSIIDIQDSDGAREKAVQHDKASQFIGLPSTGTPVWRAKHSGRF